MILEAVEEELESGKRNGKLEPGVIKPANGGSVRRCSTRIQENMAKSEKLRKVQQRFELLDDQNTSRKRGRKGNFKSDLDGEEKEQSEAAGTETVPVTYTVSVPAVMAMGKGKAKMEDFPSSENAASSENGKLEPGVIEPANGGSVTRCSMRIQESIAKSEKLRKVHQRFELLDDQNPSRKRGHKGNFKSDLDGEEKEQSEAAGTEAVPVTYTVSVPAVMALGKGKAKMEDFPSSENGKLEPGFIEPANGGSVTRCRMRIQESIAKSEKLRKVHQRFELLDDQNTSRKRGHKGNFKSDLDGEEKEQSEAAGTEAVPVTYTVSVPAVTMGKGKAKMEDFPSSENAMVEKSAYAQVKNTLRMFNKHYLHFVQEEEKRCKKSGGDRKKVKPTKSKLTKGSPSKDDNKHGTAQRPDLKAITKMVQTNSVLNSKKMFGPIPGIDAGYQFFSRAEMVVVGFHSHWLNGIDYMGQAYSKENSGYTFPLAVAIVISGQYEDNLDNSEDVVYTGQGGNNLLGNKRQVGDQVMARGNLALKNSCEQCVPVRVVRGHKCANSYVGKVYTYDGLYKVIQFWSDKGISGFTVFKYRLRRIEGQPVLTTNQVQFAYGRVPESVSEIRGLVCEDISGGQEDTPIPATNLVDDPPVAPTGYTYRRSLQVSKGVKFPANVNGCSCKGSCTDPKTCSCAKLNGGDFPYVHRDGGRLIEAKDIVFECGPSCGCGPGCVNRTSQRGIKYRLEVFRTPKKGWAVRSWDYIPSGAPVCEYVGVLMRTEEQDYDHENNYIFEIDCLQTMKGLDGRERRLRNVAIPVSNQDSAEDHKHDVPEFCIDAGKIGNIARFINHSCEPSLFVQCVLSSHHDVKLARVVLFAADNIPPLQELTYDYGYTLDSVHGPDGKIRQLACYCGAADCRKRLF